MLFCRHGIKSIINLQHPGEHAACGFGLEEGGFSYIPQDFMDNDGNAILKSVSLRSRFFHSYDLTSRANRASVFES